MINMKNKFYNADEAYEALLDEVIINGIEFNGTQAIFNCGFYILNPEDNHIKNVERNWSLKYAEAEWQWYLSGDPSINKLGELYGKIPPIWERMADESGNVNSNYGWQWKRNQQLDYVVGLLRTEPNTRQACISIYDAKEWESYKHDTPCTYAVQFTMVHGRLDMCVTMRSNDLWYGFCNDQYCFSRLQALVAFKLDVEPGVYYHFAHNMHLYNDKI